MQREDASFCAWLEQTSNFVLNERSISNTTALEIMQHSSENELKYEGLILS